MRRLARVWRLVGVWAMLGWGFAPAAFAQDEPSAVSPQASRLLKQLDTDDSYARQAAFLQLEELREPATIPMVRQRLETRDPETRAFSVRALAAIEGQPAIPTLLERLKRDRSPRVRVAALLALEPLREQHPAILPGFIDRLRDRHRDVRMAAVDAVSRVDQPEAREAIQRRWRRERDRDVRRVLEEARKRMGQEGARGGA